MDKNISYGRHIILDLHTKEHELLQNVESISKIMLEACTKAGATILGYNWHHFGEEYGVTGVVMLSESHASIHTWPETGYAAIDVYMCGVADPMIAADHILHSFKAYSFTKADIKRGQKTYVGGEILPIRLYEGEIF